MCLRNLEVLVHHILAGYTKPVVISSLSLLKFVKFFSQSCILRQHSDVPPYMSILLSLLGLGETFFGGGGGDSTMYIWVCVHIVTCVYVCTCMCMCIYVEVRGQPCMLVFERHLPYFFKASH